MKRILISVITLGLVAALAVSITGSFFSDTETSKDNILQAGELDLKIDNTSYYNGKPYPDASWEPDDLPGHLFFNFQDLKPGDWGEDTISLRVDDNDAWACMKITHTEDDDETCNEPELKDDPTCDDPDDDKKDGELGSHLSFIFWVDDGDNVLEKDEEEGIIRQQDLVGNVFDGKIINLADALGGVLGLAGPLVGSKTYYIGKAWCFGEMTITPLPDNTGVSPEVDSGIKCDGAELNNETQTDQVLVDFEFSAYQSRNNPNFTCSGEKPSGTPTPTLTPTPPLACNKADVMLVLDRSGSISSTELVQLKTAAKDFVDSLTLALDGNHAGKSSFATTGTLNHHLTSDPTSLKAAIDAMISGGWTNLKEGIDLAKTELDNPGDGHDRADGVSLDKMIVITDGNPNRPLDGDPPPDVDAKNAADVAKAAGVEIFVVGVGSDVDATYLTNDIATAGAGHYYSASDYSGLQTILSGLDLCD
ncbi:hypothetical protein A2865_00185 [Candidatus Woesebacteria bacterium RIFCSPHIGHO2_01_FULL_39_17]|uniref:von Willebrand factor, type A n=3 Tax=Candidatus Woeseibacteriota TaxID=1752722 RepID=A0A0G0QVB3_9BACT|nr:MAG: von Willebrand factor, type A [Microgenomates group bacterium GW2011_GWC1_38_12]KKQ94216.1 MAG: von Willebrand factor, type A [Candidatus Woesebacteria bacterium GW2011_GWB1_39_10b]KKR14280.1 MAG: von Willebrand factor, type A [Candidatus Woesebacteria bacterium GW2011_GWA1_39_21b]OGM23650.1 MAG: hypothetical protein A2865_00185 [Candidatus Woesebacteria bacterium RIFCSPHIGHO2_01_FULL_39_17]OGM65472.1 MAG: hypothetical protein A3A52_00925 [Candidatus Woesebacteria bacterium RIFCSPLOWO2_